MLIKLIIILLHLYESPERAANFNNYDIAKLQLMGLVDEDNTLTDHGRVVVQEILTYVQKVI